MRDRIRDHGINVYGPIDHGMCQSIYLAGPDGLALEVATSREPIDARAWIDPEVVGVLDIGEDELAELKAPAPHTGSGGSVPQPPIDWDKPQLGMPKQLLEAILHMSDDRVREKMSAPEPPVRVE